MNSGEVHPKSFMQKPAFVTNVTLYWFTAGIQFPAGNAPQKGSARLRVPASELSLRVRNWPGYWLNPRTSLGSCITGVPACI
jgi:hypothetical protein